MIDTLIIGGGAAGLYAASLIPGAVILERGCECGRKLLLTGGGRCNYTHLGSVPDLLVHYHGSRSFIRKVLYRHVPEDIIGHLRTMGIEPADEDGRIFPATGDAASIRTALLGRCGKIIVGKAVSIERLDGFLRIHTDSGAIDARHAILAAGGNAFPQTGSDGSGYAIARSAGHTITQLRPALAPLILSPPLAAAEGVNAYVTLRKGRLSVSGEAVITRRGISGPAAEDFSYCLSGREDITVSFGKMDIHALRGTNGRMLLKNAAPVPPRLAAALFGEMGEKRIANLSGEEERRAAKLISAFPASAAASSAGAMSTAGGVSTDEIDPETMESRMMPGLFLAGDIVDVDADCGGYSLTWAFATAYTASRSIRK